MIARMYPIVQWRRSRHLSRRHVIVETFDNDEQQTACGIRYRLKDVLNSEYAPIEHDTCQNCRRAVESEPSGA